ncbi:amidohydrolase family protein [Polymorphobacter sp.]|uniref:amidohydrolase family protein n=1 Tax=Polymorphobacter sp. TaxID=1909290 RepID=UPI003F6EC140
MGMKHAWLLLLAAGTAQAQPAKLQDRRAVIAPGTETTADPVRIPVRPRDASGPELVITGGRVFDGRSNAVRAATVVVQGNRIKAVLPPESRDWAANALVIDAAGKTVMPGLIDMHVHISYHDQATPIDQQASEGSGTLRGQRNLRYYLESGFTSVRDLNGVRNAPYLLSEWSAANAIPAPRVFTAGHIITGTGGHATERPVSPSHGPDFAQEADGADAWRAAVRRTFKEGASVIKIGSHFSQAEVEAAIDEAHLLGLKVTCDCETIYTEMAVKAGIDMIEHPLPRTDATIAAMARQGVTAVPTLQVYQNVLDRSGGFYGSTSRRFSMTSQGNFDVFKKMKAAGIVMGVGTDTIGDAHRYIPNIFIAELKWFVKGGYSIPEALRAATMTNAKLLDMDDRLGSLEAGKLADILIVNGNPDQDLDALRQVDMVIKDGLLMVDKGKVVIPAHVPVPLPKPAPPADTK